VLKAAHCCKQRDFDQHRNQGTPVAILSCCKSTGSAAYRFASCYHARWDRLTTCMSCKHSTCKARHWRSAASHQGRLPASRLFLELLVPAAVELLRHLLGTVRWRQVKDILQLQRPLVTLSQYACLRSVPMLTVHASNSLVVPYISMMQSAGHRCGITCPSMLQPK